MDYFKTQEGILVLGFEERGCHNLLPGGLVICIIDNF